MTCKRKRCVVAVFLFLATAQILVSGDGIFTETPGSVIVLAGSRLTLKWQVSLSDTQILFCDWQRRRTDSDGWLKFVGYNNNQRRRENISMTHVGWEFTSISAPCKGGIGRLDITQDYAGMYEFAVRDRENKVYTDLAYVTVLRPTELTYSLSIDGKLHESDLSQNLKDYDVLMVKANETLPVEVLLQWPSNTVQSVLISEQKNLYCLNATSPSDSHKCTGNFGMHNDSDLVVSVMSDVQGAETVSLHHQRVNRLQAVIPVDTGRPNLVPAVIVLAIIIVVLIVLMILMILWLRRIFGPDAYAQITKKRMKESTELDDTRARPETEIPLQENQKSCSKREELEELKNEKTSFEQKVSDLEQKLNQSEQQNEDLSFKYGLKNGECNMLEEELKKAKAQIQTMKEDMSTPQATKQLYDHLSTLAGEQLTKLDGHIRNWENLRRKFYTSTMKVKMESCTNPIDEMSSKIFEKKRSCSQLESYDLDTLKKELDQAKREHSEIKTKLTRLERANKSLVKIQPTLDSLHKYRDGIKEPLSKCENREISMDDACTNLEQAIKTTKADKHKGDRFKEADGELNKTYVLASDISSCRSQVDQLINKISSLGRRCARLTDYNAPAPEYWNPV